MSTERPNPISRTIIHAMTFFRKEILTVIRQPRLVFSLVLGPFIILMLFAIGYREDLRTLDTLFVVPEDSPLRDLIAEQAETFTQQLNVMGVTADPAEAELRLRRGEVDLVVLTPGDPALNWENNEPATFLLRHYEIDPYEQVYIDVLGRRTADELNRRILIMAVEQGKTEAADWQARLQSARGQASALRSALETGDQQAASRAADTLSQEIEWLRLAAGTGLLLAGADVGTASGLAGDPLLNRLTTAQAQLDTIGSSETTAADPARAEEAAQIEADLAELDAVLTRFRQTDSRVLVEPFRTESQSITQVDLQPIHFYVPGVLALLLQHIAVTLAGLSIISERRSGAMELFRASPISALETLLGKYLSFALFVAVVAAALTALVILVLRVPMLGDWGTYVLIMAGVAFASLGIGFFISLSVKTESQAIQYGMIVLLASIFLGGFFVALYRLWLPVRAFAYALPVTYGTELLQGTMLRGRAADPLLIGGLFAIGVVLFLVCWWMLARQMRRE